MHHVTHRLPFARFRQLQGAAQRLLDHLLRQKLQALAGIATGAPGFTAHGQKLLRAFALPGQPKLTIERVKAWHQGLGQGAQQAGITTTTVAPLNPQQGQQRIQPQPPLW